MSASGTLRGGKERQPSRLDVEGSIGPPADLETREKLPRCGLYVRKINYCNRHDRGLQDAYLGQDLVSCIPQVVWRVKRMY